MDNLVSCDQFNDNYLTDVEVREGTLGKTMLDSSIHSLSDSCGRTRRELGARILCIVSFAIVKNISSLCFVEGAFTPF